MSRPSPAAFLKHAADVASFYGFRSLRDIEKKVSGAPARTHNFTHAAHMSAEHYAARPEEPVLCYWASASPIHTPRDAHFDRRETGEFGLHIMGVSESIAEVVLLKTVAAIMSGWGAPRMRVRLNALGDKDSKARFEREVGAYVRKHAAHLSPDCRERINKEPSAPYTCSEEPCRAVIESGPRPMNFLSEKSRAHFKEVLEHLESLNVPYEFDDLLMSDEREARMLFAFDLEEEDPTIHAAYGGRFDDHFRTLSSRKELGGVSASIFFRKKGLSPEHFKLGGPSVAPSVYFIQLGVRAKLEGLSVVDTLRAARIPVLQSFDSAKLSPQLLAAREAGVSHLLIMGAREALDRTILVRAMDNSHQTIVELTELPRFLKSLK